MAAIASSSKQALSAVSKASVRQACLYNFSGSVRLLRSRGGLHYDVQPLLKTTTMANTSARGFHMLAQQSRTLFDAKRNVVQSALLSRSLSRSQYATSAYAEAHPRNHSSHVPPMTMPQSTSSSIKDKDGSQRQESSSSESEEQPDPDQPPPKASIRERLRFLSRRYGWWALGVYLLASALDFSLTFLAIHMMGADHIRELENRVRKYLGMGSREMDDVEVAAWPVPLSVESTEGHTPEVRANNNEVAAQTAAQQIAANKHAAVAQSARGSSVGSSPTTKGKTSQGTLWTEAVLAYTIHKTLLLPFRVGITAAVTPTFVKYMVRLGWARNNAAVHQAAQKVKVASRSASSSSLP